MFPQDPDNSKSQALGLKIDLSRNPPPDGGKVISSLGRKDQALLPDFSLSAIKKSSPNVISIRDS
jgi:hypothetical protein